ncbi:MAG: DUF488 domain-containing protein [Thermomicrobiales bacterium]
MIRIRRAYEDAAADDGTRVLVDRLWPRGVSKERMAIAFWAKEVAPSTELRQWFGHDPARWEDFQRRYGEELAANPAAWGPILDAARSGDVALVYGAKDEQHNDAVVLQRFLQARLDAYVSGS